MWIQNKVTKVRYEMSRESWEQLGSNQKLFKVVDETDGPNVKGIVIENQTPPLVKPETGNSKEGKDKGKNTRNNTTKK